MNKHILLRSLAVLVFLSHLPRGYTLGNTQTPVSETLITDQEDESSRKYKELLLGQNSSVVIEKDNPESVILLKMSLLVDGRPDKEINLKDVSQLKNMTFIVKEGAKYRLRLSFYVQREIVSGLKFYSKIKGKSILSTKLDYMAGSYGPKMEPYVYKTPAEDFPSGLLGLGTYSVHSVLFDDDEHKILAWDWRFRVKKDWTV